MIRCFVHHQRQRHCFSFLLHLSQRFPFMTVVKRPAYPLRLGLKENVVSMSGHPTTRCKQMVLSSRFYGARDPVFSSTSGAKKNHGIRNDGSRMYIHMHARIDRYLACSIIREVKILRVFARPRRGHSRLRLRVRYRWAILARKISGMNFFFNILFKSKGTPRVPWNHSKQFESVYAICEDN